jgi:hypothetical protein
VSNLPQAVDIIGRP